MHRWKGLILLGSEAMEIDCYWNLQASGIAMPTLQCMLEMLAAAVLLGELILLLLDKKELIKMLSDH